jgi:uncharacterized protein (DUF2147 family)
MKKAFFIITSLLATTVAFAQKATDNFTGKYKTDDGEIITIAKTSTGFVGTDEAKTIVLKDVKFDGKEWKATVYNPKKDVTASGEILLEGNKLKIVAHKGFI